MAAAGVLLAVLALSASARDWMDSAAANPATGPDANIEVRDFGTPPMAQRVSEGKSRGLRVAGRWAAWVEGSWRFAEAPGDIVVYDRSAMREAYRIPKSELGTGVHSLDLQEDGKVAFVIHGPPGVGVAWASPAEPRVHRLPLPDGLYEVRIAGDKIGFLRGRSVFLVAPLADVGVTDLAGNAQILARGAEDDLGRESFDFDGERVAWWSFGCTDAQVHMRRVADGPQPYRARSGCKLVLERAPLANRAGEASILPDCYGFVTRRCSIFTVRVTRGGKLVASGSGYRVKLTGLGRRLLRPGGRLKVRVTATLTDAAGRRERRTGTTTMRRKG